MNNLVSESVARKDVERFLDSRKTSPARREDLKDQIDILVEMVMDGSLIVNEDCTLKYTLSFPEGFPFPELKFKNRLQVRDVHEILRNHVKSGDGDGRIYAYLAALSGITFGEIRLLDSYDSGRLSNISVFFM